jgi:hypothetical protein
MEYYQTIPLQYRVVCSGGLHAEPFYIDTRSHRTFQRCSGWSVNRKAGQGTNNLFLMERIREWCCASCIDSMRKKTREHRPGGLALCAFDCGTKLDKLQLGTYQLITGWVSGNRGTGGGQGIGRNSTAIPERQDSYACDDCIKRQMQGISLDQGTLDLGL